MRSVASGNSSGMLQKSHLIRISTYSISIRYVHVAKTGSLYIAVVVENMLRSVFTRKNSFPLHFYCHLLFWFSFFLFRFCLFYAILLDLGIHPTATAAASRRLIREKNTLFSTHTQRAEHGAPRTERKSDFAVVAAPFALQQTIVFFLFGRCRSNFSYTAIRMVARRGVRASVNLLMKENVAKTKTTTAANTTIGSRRFGFVAFFFCAVDCCLLFCVP